MITPDKKTKKKNILTALGIIAFMIFLFFLPYTIPEFSTEQYDKEKEFNTHYIGSNFCFNARLILCSSTFI